LLEPCQGLQMVQQQLQQQQQQWKILQLQLHRL
jgi:hypothetical protein